MEETFIDSRNMDLKRHKLAFFQSMILLKKLRFFNVLCLSKIDGEKAFSDVLDRKQVSEDYKKIGI